MKFGSMSTLWKRIAIKLNRLSVYLLICLSAGCVCGFAAGVRVDGVKLEVGTMQSMAPLPPTWYKSVWIFHYHDSECWSHDGTITHGSSSARGSLSGYVSPTAAAAAADAATITSEQDPTTPPRPTHHRHLLNPSLPRPTRTTTHKRQVL